MAFNDAFIGELLAKNDIVNVISSYTELKPKGRRLWGLCPLHGEKTPSFSVSPDKQLYYCFGCHAGGSVIQFIMEAERLSYGEAVKFLADRAGLAMPDEVDDTAMRRERAHKERLCEAMKLSARFFMERLLGARGRQAQAYLLARGITSDSVKRFGIGCAPDEWDALMKHLYGLGFEQRELLDAGLLVRNDQRGTVYDTFRNRIMYPIVGLNGRVLGFGARVMGDEKPKYINTGDTPIYNKRNNLYGLNLQKGQKPESLVMVEGYMDVIGLYEAGVTNVVASLGTALTTQQARLLKRYVNTVYIAYDGDSAGQTATIRGLDILSQQGLDVRVIVFPDGLDPDEFVRQRGAAAFDRLRDEALSLHAFKLDAMANGLNMTVENDRERYAISACRLIAGLQPVERDRYYMQVARKTGYAIEALKAQTGASKPPLAEREKRPHAGKNAVRASELDENERKYAEMTILRAMLESKDAAMAVIEGRMIPLFSDPVYAAFANEILSAYARDAEPSAAVMIAEKSAEDTDKLRIVMREDADLSNPQRTVRDCASAIRRYDARKRLHELTELLENKALDAEEQNKVMLEIQDLNNQMRG